MEKKEKLANMLSDCLHLCLEILEDGDESIVDVGDQIDYAMMILVGEVSPEECNCEHCDHKCDEEPKDDGEPNKSLN